MTNKLAALFTSLIASLYASRSNSKRSARNIPRASMETIRKSGPSIDARKARRLGKTTHRQQKRERMSVLRMARP